MGSWSLVGNTLGTPPSGILGTADNNALVIETSGKEHLRVDPSGNVGISENSPAGPLHITGPAGAPPAGLPASQNGLLLGLQSTGGYKWIQSYGGPLVLNPAGNYVGIGTQSPNARLEVIQDWSNDGIRVSGGRNPLMAATDGTIRAKVQVLTGTGGLVGTETNHDFGIYTTNTERLRVTASGSVGIGTATPGQKLDVEGPVIAANGANAFEVSTDTAGTHFWTNNAYDRSKPFDNWTQTLSMKDGNVMVTGDILLTGADCAEDFDVSGSQALEPGTVVVIDQAGSLRESRQPYDKKVAGVVSGAGAYRHGLVLDKRPSEEARIPVALVGKAYCKVDAQYSPVEVGDLLTTSPTPGHAMNAIEPAKAFGAVIGKALRPLQDGQGLIPILIALE